MSQPLLEKAHSSGIRKKVVQTIKACPFLVVFKNYSTGRSRTRKQSTTYQLVGIEDLKQNPDHPKAADDLDQDKTDATNPGGHQRSTAGREDESEVGGEEGKGREIDSDSLSEIDGCVVDDSKITLWICDEIIFSIDGTEFDRQLTVESEAREELGWNKVRDFVLESLARLRFDFDDVSVRNVFLETHISEKVEAKTQDAKRRNNKDFDPKEYRESYSRNVWGFVDAIDSGKFTIKERYGRLYHEGNQFPGVLREHLRVETEDGELEPLSEADLSGSFHVIIGSSCGCQDMIRDLKSGKYYEKLGRMATKFGYRIPLAEDGTIDRGTLKKDIQIHCLFNKWSEGFTQHPLWKALDSTYPKAAQRIIYWRRQPYGARRLSEFLSNQEGLLFLDHVIPELQRRGIPVISNHDGVLVPESRVNEAKAIIEHFAMLQFKFRAVVKTKPTRSAA